MPRHDLRFVPTPPPLRIVGSVRRLSPPPPPQAQSAIARRRDDIMAGGAAARRAATRHPPHAVDSCCMAPQRRQRAGGGGVGDDDNRSASIRKELSPRGRVGVSCYPGGPHPAVSIHQGASGYASPSPSTHRLQPPATKPSDMDMAGDKKDQFRFCFFIWSARVVRDGQARQAWR